MMVEKSKMGTKKPKWKKHVIKDDYFGDVAWWICKECSGLPTRQADDCRCSCVTPKGQCRGMTA